MNLFSQFFGAPIPHVDPQSAKAKLDSQPKPFLLDVREPAEYRAEHIAGATLIPLGELPHRVHELPRNREIICVCRSGNRSDVAARHLVSAGYTAINLSGGMINWSRNGLPVKRNAGR